MNYDTFIFDLDGTLLDTLDDLAAAVNHALAAYGMPLRSCEEVRSFVGNGVRLLMERAVPDGAQNPLFDQAFAEFRAYYMEHSLTPPVLTTASCRCLESCIAEVAEWR